MAPATTPKSLVIYRKNGQWKRESASAVRWESVFMGRLYFPPRRKKKVTIRNSSCVLCVCPFNRKQLSCHASCALKTAVLGRQNLNPRHPLAFNCFLSADAHSHTRTHTQTCKLMVMTPNGKRLPIPKEKNSKQRGRDARKTNKRNISANKPQELGEECGGGGGGGHKSLQRG